MRAAKSLILMPFSSNLVNNVAILCSPPIPPLKDIPKTLRVTPAMEAGISDHVWSIEEIVRLVPEPVAKKRGTYNKSINVLK